MKMYKRLFAFLLSIVITLSFMPAIAFAEDDDDPGMWNGYKWGDYTLNAGSTYTAEIYEPREYYSFKFTPDETGTYTFRSTGTFDTYGRILDDNGDELDYADGGGDEDNFSIDFDAEADKTYYLQACMFFYDSIGTFTVELSKTSGSGDDDETDASERWGGNALYDEEFGIYYDDDFNKYYGYEYVTIENPYDYASFTFSPLDDGYYCFRATGDCNTFGRVMDYSDPDFASFYKEDDSSGDGDNFSIVFKADEEETYYLQAAMYGGETGDFEVELETYDPGMWKGQMSGPYPISVNVAEEVDPMDPREYFRFKFTPSASGKYIFRSIGSDDTCGRVLDENENVIGENDDIDEDTNTNFSITFSALQGKTYYLETCMYKLESGLYDVEVVKDETPPPIQPKSIAKASVSNVVPKDYTGRAITQAPIVTLNGVRLTNGVDYTLSYVGNVNPTTAAYVIITGKGSYTGTINRTFVIRPVVPAIKLTKVTKGSKSFTAKWPKASAAVQRQFTGYQIQYGTSKAFLSSKTKNTTQKGSKKVVIRKLKKKKTYYVRIRRYYKWNGQLLYSAWSPAKKVKTK